MYAWIMEGEAVLRQLISLVKEYPSIYNNTAGYLRNRKRNRQAWKKIGSIMGYTDEQCKRQWCALRSGYSRILREKRDNVKRKQNWYLEEDLAFLESYVTLHRMRKRKPRETTSSDTESNSSESSRQPLPSDSLNSKAFAQFSRVVAEPDAGKSTIKITPVPTITIEDEEEEKPKLQPNPIIPVEDPERNLITDSNSYTQTFLINEIASPTQSTDKTTDDQANSSNRLFLQSLLLDMNKLPEKKQRIFKRKTLALMEDLFDDYNS